MQNAFFSGGHGHNIIMLSDEGLYFNTPGPAHNRPNLSRLLEVFARWHTFYSFCRQVHFWGSTNSSNCVGGPKARSWQGIGKTLKSKELRV
jgi:hypothetical protein